MLNLVKTNLLKTSELFEGITMRWYEYLIIFFKKLMLSNYYVA